MDIQNYGNDNLTAQKGKFTLVIGENSWHDQTEFLPLDETFYHIVEKISTSKNSHFMLFKHHNKVNTKDYFIRYTLPLKEVVVIMKLLHSRLYHAATIFPGLKGCEMAIEELEKIDILSKELDKLKIEDKN